MTRRTIQFHRFTDGRDPAEAGFYGATRMSESTRAQVARWTEDGATFSRHLRLLVNQSPAEGAFSSLYIWFKPNYQLSRPSHR